MNHEMKIIEYLKGNKNINDVKASLEYYGLPSKSKLFQTGIGGVLTSLVYRRGFTLEDLEGVLDWTTPSLQRTYEKVKQSAEDNGVDKWTDGDEVKQNAGRKQETTSYPDRILEMRKNRSSYEQRYDLETVERMLRGGATLKEIGEELDISPAMVSMLNKAFFNVSKQEIRKARWKEKIDMCKFLELYYTSDVNVMDIPDKVDGMNSHQDIYRVIEDFGMPTRK